MEWKYVAETQKMIDEAVGNAPELKGSEAQIKWANGLRRDAIAAAVDELIGSPAKHEMAIIQRRLTPMALAIAGVLAMRTRADSWIDHRTVPLWFYHEVNRLMLAAVPKPKNNVVSLRGTQNRFNVSAPKAVVLPELDGPR